MTTTATMLKNIIDGLVRPTLPALPYSLFVYHKIQASLITQVRETFTHLMRFLTLSLVLDLLDQDSEMQRAFGEFGSASEPSAHLHEPSMYLNISIMKGFN